MLAKSEECEEEAAEEDEEKEALEGRALINTSGALRNMAVGWRCTVSRTNASAYACHTAATTAHVVSHTAPNLDDSKHFTHVTHTHGMSLCMT